MKALRAFAAVMAVSMTFILVGCGDDDTTDEQQTSNQTGATTFGASVSNGSGNEIGARHGSGGGHAAYQSQVAVVETN